MRPAWFLATTTVIRRGQWIHYHQVKPNTPGVELKFVFPGGYWTHLLSFTTNMDPSLAVGNRFIRWQISDGNNIIYMTGLDAAQIANNPKEYTLKAGSAAEFGNLTSDVVLSIPDMWLPPGSFIQTNTLNLDPGDNWVARGCWCEQIDKDTLRSYMGSRVFGRLDHLYTATPPA